MNRNRGRNTATTQAEDPQSDSRLALLNAFMNCPHRDTDKIKEIHDTVRGQDPLFYAHLACWYDRAGSGIRDHKEVFTAMLLTDPYIENREVGLALFRDMPLFMKNKVIGFIKGKKVKIRTKTGESFVRRGKSIGKVRVTEVDAGLHTNIPGSLKSEVKQFLRWLEKRPKTFDAMAVRSFFDLKNLYRTKGLQIKPSDRAQKILFEGDRPKDSKLEVTKRIQEAATPEEAARLIVEHKIPYTVAVGLVEKVTPSILAALVNNMSPQEVINNIASLEERGAMDVPEIKVVVDKKLKKAQTAKGVSALKSKTAVATGRVKNAETSKKLDKVADKQIKRQSSITIPTAIFVDRSGSMHEAIEVGKRLAAVVSGAIEAPMSVVAFDDAPMEVVSQGKEMSDWERAFAPVRPHGRTSMGCALRFLMHKGFMAEQIVIVTDEGENCNPMFASVYRQYQDQTGLSPHVVIIRVGVHISDVLSRSLERSNIEYDRYEPEGNDYYGLPGIVHLLARKSRLDLVFEIMDEPLRRRRSFK